MPDEMNAPSVLITLETVMFLQLSVAHRVPVNGTEGLSSMIPARSLNANMLLLKWMCVEEPLLTHDPSPSKAATQPGRQ